MYVTGAGDAVVGTAGTAVAAAAAALTYMATPVEVETGTCGTTSGGTSIQMGVQTGTEWVSYLSGIDGGADDAGGVDSRGVWRVRAVGRRS